MRTEPHQGLGGRSRVEHILKEHSPYWMQGQTTEALHWPWLPKKCLCTEGWPVQEEEPINL